MESTSLGLRRTVSARRLPVRLVHQRRKSSAPSPEIRSQGLGPEDEGPGLEAEGLDPDPKEGDRVPVQRSQNVPALEINGQDPAQSTDATGRGHVHIIKDLDPGLKVNDPRKVKRVGEDHLLSLNIFHDHCNTFVYFPTNVFTIVIN